VLVFSVKNLPRKQRIPLINRKEGSEDHHSLMLMPRNHHICSFLMFTCDVS